METVPSEQDSYDFDSATSKFHGFLASSQLHNLRDWRNGRWPLSHWKVNGHLDSTWIKSALISKTINVGIYEDPKHLVKYFDTAGLDENRGEAYQCWARFSLQTARSLLGELKATIVTINFRSTFEGTGDANKIRDLAEFFGNSFGCAGGRLSESCYNNMCFMMTNINSNDTDLQIIPSVFKMYEAELEQLRCTLKGLTKRVGGPEQTAVSALTLTGKLCATAVDKVISTFQLNGGYFDDKRYTQNKGPVNKKYEAVLKAWRAINLAKLVSLPDDDVDKKMCLRLTASVQLLETILSDGSDRMLLSYPNGYRKCEQQRVAVNEMICHCTALTHCDLLNSNSGGNLRVFGLLGHVARNLTNPLQNLVLCCENLLQTVDQHKSVFDSINTNWSGYRTLRLEQMERELGSLRGKVASLELSIERLRSSEKLVSPPTYVYVIAQCRKTWIQWFGLQRDVYVFKHEGSYIDYKITDTSNYHLCNELKKDGQYLELEFIGCLHSDIKVCVRVRRYEKDTADAKSTIASEECSLAQKQERIATLEEKMCNMKVCESKESLVGILLHLNSDQLTLYQDAIKTLDDEVPTTLIHGKGDAEVRVSTWAVCMGLHHLLDSMLEKNAFPVEMETDLLNTLNKFVALKAECDRVLTKIEQSQAVTYLSRASASPYTVDSLPTQASSLPIDVHRTQD